MLNCFLLSAKKLKKKNVKVVENETVSVRDGYLLGTGDDDVVRGWCMTS